MICQVTSVKKQQSGGTSTHLWRHIQYVLKTNDGRKFYGGQDVYIYPGCASRTLQLAEAVDNIWHMKEGDSVEFNNKNAFFPILKVV